MPVFPAFGGVGRRIRNSRPDLAYSKFESSLGYMKTLSFKKKKKRKKEMKEI